MTHSEFTIKDAVEKRIDLLSVARISTVFVMQMIQCFWLVATIRSAKCSFEQVCKEYRMEVNVITTVFVISSVFIVQSKIKEVLEQVASYKGYQRSFLTEDGRLGMGTAIAKRHFGN